jgi:hypothetical protein
MEGFVLLDVVEYVLLIAFAGILAFSVFESLDDQKINEFKAEDLELTIDSMFLTQGNFNVAYPLGGEYQVEVLNNRVRVFASSADSMGLATLFLDGNYDFAENIRGKVNVVKINKEGKRLVVS